MPHHYFHTPNFRTPVLRIPCFLIRASKRLRILIADQTLGIEWDSFKLINVNSR